MCPRKALFTAGHRERRTNEPELLESLRAATSLLIPLPMKTLPHVLMEMHLASKQGYKILKNKEGREKLGCGHLIAAIEVTPTAVEAMTFQLPALLHPVA